VFKVRLTRLDITVSIDSDSPDRRAQIVVAGENSQFMKQQIASMTGMYGHIIGNSTAPLDLNAALAGSGLDFEILEGADILKMPRQELPDGAKW
jgi:hypothetical protein